jgi:uncharacterized protein YPO0396
MRLSRISLVNWHTFSKLDLDVHGDLIAVIGPNKSGKSTILDLIQTVLTGCDQSALGLNKASTSGRSGTASKRSVQSYCLGRLGEGEHVVREEAITYVSLTYRDDIGGRPETTLGLALEARRSEPSVNVVARFIATGFPVTSDDYVEAVTEGLRVPVWPFVREGLERKAAQAGGKLEIYRDTAKDFVREYMQRTFARGRSTAQSQFIKNFVNALTFQGIDGATEFVRNSLLEEQPIRLEALRNSIKIYRDAANTVEELERNLSMLRIVQSKLEELKNAEFAVDLEEWLAMRAGAIEGEVEYRGNRVKIARKSAERDDALRKAGQAESEVERALEEIDLVKQEIRQARSEDTQDQLKKQLLENDELVGELRRPATGGFVADLRKLNELKPLMSYIPSDAMRAASQVLKLIPSPPASFPQDPKALDEALDRLLAVIPQARAPIAMLHGQALVEVQKATAELEQAKRELAGAKAGRAVFDVRVEQMVDYLRSQGMKPRVVAEVLEVIDPDWAQAAEGFLGRDREAILVDAEHAERAIRILGDRRREFPGVRIANTRKLEGMPSTPHPGTLASVFGSENKLAMALVVFRAGNVNLAQSHADLNKQGRWIMRDGTYDDSVIVEVKSPHRGLQLGVGALKSRVGELAGEVQELEAKINERLEQARALSRRELSLAKIEEADIGRDTSGQVVHFSTLSERLAQAEYRAANIRNKIAELSNIDVSDLLARKAELEEVRKEAIDGSRTESGRAGGLQTEINSLRATISGGEGQVGSNLYRRNARGKFERALSRLVGNRVHMRAEYRSRLHGRRHGALSREAAAKVQDMRESNRELRTECEFAVNRLLSAMNSTDVFTSKPKLHGEVRPWVDERIEAIEQEELVQHQLLLKRARDEATTIFQTSFVNELAGRFAKVKHELAAVKDVLDRYPFLNERYSFRSTPDLGYEAFHRIVDRQRELEFNNIPLFRSESESDELAAQLATVQEVLLAENVDIRKFEDYRRYFTFEIDITDVDSGRTVSWSSRRGTGSGAEKQTPYYVALAAALSSAYYGGARNRLRAGETGMCLAVFDEAFSNMDSKVRVQVIEFCQDLGLQLLVAAPDTARQSLIEHVDCIVDIWRSGDNSFAEVESIKQKTHEELAAINPRNLAREKLQELMNAAE